MQEFKLYAMANIPAFCLLLREDASDEPDRYLFAKFQEYVGEWRFVRNDDLKDCA